LKSKEKEKTVMKIKENYKLRQPTGPYVIGATYFKYHYNPENNPAPRLVPAVCFYPALDRGEGQLKKYVSERVVPGAGGIETNSYLNVPVAEGAHPLLLFSHGFSLGYESNTVQCEELASHGYIVVSLGHLGDGSYELENGEVSLFNVEEKMVEFAEEAAASADIFTVYPDWLRGEGQTASFEEHRAYYQSIIERQRGMVRQAEPWLQDSQAALAGFLTEAEQPGALFYGHVDRARIGAFGMSFGGSVALDLAQTFPEIRAGADLDGFYFSPNWDVPFTRPVLMMQHDGLGGLFLTYPFMNAAGETYLATVKNTTHGNFMDYNELLAENESSMMVLNGKETEVAMLGKIDPDRMEIVMNTLLLDFFNKYLRGAASRILDTANVPGEIELLRKTGPAV
jgi:dienelactone hydrolase